MVTMDRSRTGSQTHASEKALRLLSHETARILLDAWSGVGADAPYLFFIIGSVA
jgi:hypothetical protein